MIADDIAAGRYFGAVIAVARAGAWGFTRPSQPCGRGGSRPLRLDSVFSIFSVTKAITNVLVLRAIELGRFALTTRISDLVPRNSRATRNEIRVHHLLSHTSGLPIVFSIKPDLYIDRFDEVVAALCANVRPRSPRRARRLFAHGEPCPPG